MSQLDPFEAFRQVVIGARVDRATDTLPETTDEALFTISGGRVMITSIVGEVTTVIETKTNETKLKFNPDATGEDTDLCAVLDITADAVGTLYSITGDFSDALVAGLLCLESPAVLQRPIILSEGDIEIETGATSTGSVSWTLTYIPLDNGARIEAA